MKRTLTFVCCLLAVGIAFSQKVAKNEVKALQSFLAQPSAKGGTNAQALGITDLGNPSSWEGVTVTDGSITAIKWDRKHLGGSLNLNGFKNLASVDISDNHIKTVSLTQLPALVSINAGKNSITEAVITGCPQLQVVKFNRNHLSNLDLSDVPFLKSLNVAQNQVPELDVSNAVNLKYLNCMSNRLEKLTLTGCQSLKTVYAGYNHLTEIITAGLVSLENLNLNSNMLQKLYIQDLPALVTLSRATTILPNLRPTTAHSCMTCGCRTTTLLP